MVPVVAVGILVVVTVVAMVGVSSLAAGERSLLGSDRADAAREGAETPGMALSLVVEGDTVVVSVADGSRVPLASLTLVVRWEDGVEQVSFATGELRAADGELGPGDEWSWDGGCVLPEPGSSVTLRVVHEPSDGVVTATTRPVERGRADRIGVESCAG